MAAMQGSLLLILGLVPLGAADNNESCEASALLHVKLTRKDGCPCKEGACFDDAPWDDLKQQQVMVQHLNHGTKSYLKSSQAQDDPLWVSNQAALGFHSGMMGSPKTPGWTVLNSTPSVFVRLQDDYDDATKAIKFAAEHNLKLVVKNTGHDWFGRSMGKGLMLWTHHLKDSQWHDNFQPDGCSESAPAATFSAGVQFWQVFMEMRAHKRAVVTGTCATVGHVGFTLGGGYGDYSRFFGSGASNLLEAEVVLANGQTVTASACNEYKDLFRALRGGGPGYGLVRKFTYRTFEEPQESGQIGGFVHGNLAEKLDIFLQWYKDIVNQDKAKNFGGILMFASPTQIQVNLKFVGISAADCDRLLSTSRFFDDIKCKAFTQFNGDIEFQKTFMPSQNGAEGFQPDWLKNMASSYHVGSLTRYVELPQIEGTERERLCMAVAEAVRMAHQALSHPAGDAVVLSLNYVLGRSDQALKHFDETSANPQVGTAIFSVKLDWMEGKETPDIAGSDAKLNLRHWHAFAKAKKALDEVLKTSGGYVNEGDISEENWPQHYWGSNYDFLLSMKKKYDPQNLFTCFQCVGADSSGCQ